MRAPYCGEGCVTRMRIFKSFPIVFHIFVISLFVCSSAKIVADGLVELPRPVSLAEFSSEAGGDSPVIHGEEVGKIKTAVKQRKDGHGKNKFKDKKKSAESDKDDKPLVFLIHGSKGRLGTWYKPGGSFYKELATHTVGAGLGEIIPFPWSGRSGPPESRFESVREHIRAAEDFVEKILEKTRGRSRKLVLIGHSNGGVISMLVSHMLYNPKVQGKTPPELFRKLTESESKVRVLLECREAIEEAIQRQQARWTAEDKPFEIAELFTMGTPIDTALYTINPAVIKSLYVLFSAGDSVQRFFGKRHYPKSANILNIRVCFETPRGGIVYPWHTYFCNNDTVARYILDLPTVVRRRFGNDFSKLKGIDAKLPTRGGVPTIVEIDHWKLRTFIATGF